MTNSQIKHLNNEMCTDLIKPNFNYDEEGNISCDINYNFIEPISMLSYHNRCFYEKNLIVKDSVIYDKGNLQHYLVYFDPMIYYENTSLMVNLKKLNF